jgi:dTDP-4-dehydrorhamnose reductase
MPRQKQFRRHRSAEAHQTLRRGQKSALTFVHFRRRTATAMHVSADDAFDGTKDSPYREDNRVALRGYRRFKEADERAAYELCSQPIISRVPWMDGRRDDVFQTTMRLATQEAEFTIVGGRDDNPASTADLALTVCVAARLAVSQPVLCA